MLGNRLSHAMSPAAKWGCVAAYAGLVGFLSLLPGRSFPELGSAFFFADKLVHFLMYGLMAAIACWAAASGRSLSVYAVSVIAVVCGCYGVLMEFLQELLRPMDRTFSLGDIGANFVGCVIAAYVCWAFLRRSKQAR